MKHPFVTLKKEHIYNKNMQKTRLLLRAITRLSRFKFIKPMYKKALQICSAYYLTVVYFNFVLKIKRSRADLRCSLLIGF